MHFLLSNRSVDVKIQNARLSREFSPPALIKPRAASGFIGCKHNTNIKLLLKGQCVMRVSTKLKVDDFEYCIRCATLRQTNGAMLCAIGKPSLAGSAIHAVLPLLWFN
jgi:hypothetical protein